MRVFISKIPTYIGQFRLQITNRQIMRLILRYQSIPLLGAPIKRGRGLESNDRKDHNAGEHRSPTIGQRHEQGVPVAIIIRRIVRTKRNQSPEGQAQREEDLSASLQPDHRIQQGLPPGREQVGHPIGGSLQCDAPKEEDDEDDIRKDGGHVDNLPRRRYALDHADVDEEPGDDQRYGHVIVEVLRQVDALRALQGGAIPVELRRRRGHALGLMVVREILIESRGAVRPRQRRLEAVQQIDQAPGNDCVVVQGHYVADHRRGDPNPAQIRRDLAPHADGALAQSLANGQFQVEDRYALDAQHDEVRDQEGAAAVLLGQVREAPDVAQAHGVAGVK